MIAIPVPSAAWLAVLPFQVMTAIAYLISCSPGDIR